MVLASDAVSVTFIMYIYIRLQTFWMFLKTSGWKKPRSKVYLQRNPSFGETLDQVHFSCRKLCWKVKKYDVNIFWLTVSGYGFFWHDLIYAFIALYFLLGTRPVFLSDIITLLLHAIILWTNNKYRSFRNSPYYCLLTATLLIVSQEKSVNSDP